MEVQPVQTATDRPSAAKVSAAGGVGVWSEAGKLRRVLVCAPGLAHLRLTPSTAEELLFDDVVWVSQAKRVFSHKCFQSMLSE